MSARRRYVVGRFLFLNEYERIRKMKEIFDFDAIWRTLVGALVVGVAWAADHESAVITTVAMVVVWLVNALAKWKGITLGRAKLTAVLYVLAMVMSVAFKWQMLPLAPIWHGDPAAFAAALIEYGTVLITLSSVYVGGATAIYNMLLKQVFDKLTPKAQ